MRKFLIEENLQKNLMKLSKKDRVLYEATMNKIQEIIECVDINHYKSLRSPMQSFKRVHIKGSFVLIFKYNRGEDLVAFYDLDHHDKIYS
ncbi:addiction module toxin RelE [Candidatus Woesearchaeota archaeon]|nr:addiction module toxin RelE [Candidatus Woesearchaeota archaeon]